MKAKKEQSQAVNPNPVLIVRKDSTVFYSNEAGESLLNEWHVKIGGKLPSCIGDIVKNAVSLNKPEKMEVKIEKKVYLVAFHPSSEEKCVNIYGFDITEQKELEEKLRIKEKQNAILYKIGKVALEYENLQNFLDESVKLIASILEIEYCKVLELMPDGNFLLRAGFGWKHGLVGKTIVRGEKESQAGYTLLSRMPVVVEDFAEERRFKRPEILRMHEVDSGVSVKIGSSGKIFGVLGVHSRKKRKFTSDDTYFLSSVAFLISQVIERKKAEEALKEAHDNLEKTVKERTAELEKSYISLKESEKRLAEAQKMAHIGNWDWNIVTGEVYWSDEMFRIFGRSPQESGATYDELLNYIHSDDRDFVYSAIKKTLYEKPSGIDYRIVLDNGEERTVHAQSEVTFDENNIPVRAKGIVQDITEHKKAEEKLQTLANAVESSNDAIGTMSLDSVITSWNKGAEQVYGYSAEEILGMTGSILAPPHLSEETKKLIERAKKGEKIHNYETSRLRKDGTIINVSVTFSPVFDASGKLTAISVIARDITEGKKAEEKLRESEEKYRNIVETANEGILIIDDEAIITYANEKMTDMLGYTLEEGIGRSVWDFADEEGKSILKQNLEKRRQGINESYELKLVCKDGSPLWARINAKSLFDKDDKFMGTMSMLTDITERKKAEEALERMDKVRIKEIHHRIKNNLQIISSLLDLQAEKFEDGNVIEAFREGQNRVISMSLIHEELYKGEGTDTLDFSAYLKKLAENLFKTYSLSSKNISLSMDLEEDTFLDMDTAVPLGIIVNELVSNSLKHAFTEKKDGKIRIQLCREENNREMNMSLFSLTISDDGKGLPEDLELECAESLGLQLVNILVDQLDGKLEFKREQGTEFTIRFNVVEKIIRHQ